MLSAAGCRFADLPPRRSHRHGKSCVDVPSCCTPVQTCSWSTCVETSTHVCENYGTGEFDALILAEAGLQRLELTEAIAEIFDKQIMLPAVGQGALGLEIREDDLATQRIVLPLNDPRSFQAVRAERALLARLRGGCLAPVGAWGRFVDDQLWLDAVVLDPMGTQRLQASLSDDGERALELGQRAADRLLEQGAGDLIAQARRASGPSPD